MGHDSPLVQQSIRASGDGNQPAQTAGDPDAKTAIVTIAATRRLSLTTRLACWRRAEVSTGGDGAVRGMPLGHAAEFARQRVHRPTYNLNCRSSRSSTFLEQSPRRSSNRWLSSWCPPSRLLYGLHSTAESSS